ncbi:UDP-glucuronosyltransferase 2B17-like [Tubulanus polymorphus]|uniref:UDP-glucuronosyltransferase 2B17-like n=1 Tax=Tubulanus polymorphus TaxID=672921 RepID=UPI003DA1FB8F
MALKMRLVYVGLSLLMAIHLASSAKIVIFTMQVSGHLSEFGGVGAALVRRGHEVHIVLDKHIPKPPQITESGMKILQYESPNASFVDPIAFDMHMSEVLLKRPEMVLEEVVRPRIDYDCQHTLYNKELIEKILEMKFDFALTDGLFFCYALIPYKYNIPFAAVGTPTYSYLTRLHPLLGVDPCHVAHENTFLKRLEMFVTSIVAEHVPGWFVTESKFMNYAPEKPYKSLFDVQRTAALHILNQNHIVDCPRPGMPNVVYAGGLNAKPGKPLPKEFEDFVVGAKRGVVVVSFGSMLSELPPEYARVFIEAFSKLKQRVVWRYIPNGELERVKLPDNVMVSKWLPQNDLLAHKNTKVFVTHCGSNGQTEAIYHGVPMLGVPIQGDQPYNAYRIVAKGFGLKVDFRRLNVNELITKINKLVDDPTYKTAVSKASRIFKSQPHPADHAAYWIEHVILFGSDHLKTAAHNMTSFQFLMFDIYAFLTVAVVVALALLVCLLSSICKRVIGGSSPKHDSKKNI